MFVLPYSFKGSSTRQKAYGFSICALPKSILVLSGLLGLVGLSSLYHAALFGYTYPDWALPMLVGSIIPFGCRIRVTISEDCKLIYREHVLYGCCVKQVVYENGEAFTRFQLKPTDILKNQFYFVVESSAGTISVHYCMVKPKKVNHLETSLKRMLGMKHEEDASGV